MSTLCCIPFSENQTTANICNISSNIFLNRDTTLVSNNKNSFQKFIESNCPIRNHSKSLETQYEFKHFKKNQSPVYFLYQLSISVKVSANSYIQSCSILQQCLDVILHILASLSLILQQVLDGLSLISSTLSSSVLHGLYLS